MAEYIGSKLEMTRLPSGIGRVKFTQPVLIEKLKKVHDDLPRHPKTSQDTGCSRAGTGHG